MRSNFVIGSTLALAVVTTPAAAQFGGSKPSSARQQQTRGEAQIPHCTRKLGALAIVEPDNQWWRSYNLESPEAVLRVFVQQSGCFTLVNRGRSMQTRAMERAMAESGELRAGSQMGRGQVRAADYFLEPNIVTSNRNSGGGGVGAIAGGLLGRSVLGGIVGGINVKKSEATVTLSIVNARSTEEEALTQGYARKSDIGFGGGAGGGWWGGFGAAGGAGYQNTEIGQVIVLAYLDAYTKLVTELGGLSPAPPPAPPPPARRRR